MRLVTFELTTPLGPVRRTGAIDGADHEFITQEADVVPGDLLGSGTIGMGCGFERDRNLTPGMTIGA
ncbi:MAG TPA: hypothetical protein VGH45_08355 [Solirubrobacteraceae bacterium]